ncbi:MAG: glycosidase [Bacteroidota bacterium]|nr:glycosidase [Bacteroidota bacterium]
MNNPSSFATSVERLNNGEPLLEKIQAHQWENKVTFNPACALVEEKNELRRIVAGLPFDNNTKQRLNTFPALCFLLYRAQGEKNEANDYTHSSIGLAVLSPELEFLARHNEPVIRPELPYENLGVEDARITKTGDKYIMTYTAYGTGQPQNTIRIAVASSTDFVHWEKHGLLNGSFNTIDNKNAMLFQGKINGKHVMLHRPMEGNDALCIHWAESDDIFGQWKTRGVLMKPIPNEEFIDTWIGGGAPPLLLSDGRYLIIYHIGNRKADRTREYDLAIAVGDPSTPEFIVKRNEPLLRPSSPAETKGDAELGVNNVVFICGAYFYNSELYFPYAGADSVVLGGKIRKEELKKYLS